MRREGVIFEQNKKFKDFLENLMLEKDENCIEDFLALMKIMLLVLLMMMTVNDEKNRLCVLEIGLGLNGDIYRMHLKLRSSNKSKVTTCIVEMYSVCN